MSLWSLSTCVWKLNLECYQQTCIVISTFKLLHDVVSRSFQRLTLCHDVVSMLFQCSDYITCLMGFSTTMN